MAKTTLAYGFFACVLVTSIASGYGLYVVNRERAVEQFQDRQLHTAFGVATTLRSEVGGLARTLRLIAGAAAADGDPRTTQQLLDQQFECVESPCFESAALYDAGGRTRYALLHGIVGLSGDEVTRSLRWASDPAQRSRIRTAISTAETPSLVLMTPTLPGAVVPARGRPAAAILAGEVTFDAIFGRQQRVDEKWPGSTTLVLDGDGNVVFHSRHPEMRLNNVRKRTSECFECHDTFWYVDHMLQTKSGVVQYSVHGVPHLGAFTPVDVEGQPWIAAVMGPAESATGIVAAQGRELGALMFATVLALGAAVHLTWKDDRRRLEAETAAARKAHLERSHAELTTLNTRLESAAVEWRTTVDTIDAALIVLEPFGSIRRMNRAACDLLPGEPFSWIGEPSERLAAHRPWAAALTLARDAIARDTILTARVSCEDTGRTWDLWCRPSQRMGKRDSVVIVARDITALVTLQESLRRSETMAELGSLVAGVAHEVRNPLFAISSLVDAWSVQKQADAKPFHQALRNEVGRLKSLMNDLLEYGTPSKSDPRAYPLGSITHEAMRSCAHEAETRGVRLVIARDDEVSVWADPQRFVRVLINVIQNAVQHAPRDSAVTIATTVRQGRQGSYAHITVHDRGPGFKADDLPRVFTPFFSRRAGGFGLGLAISERIVEEHHGTIAAANHPDGGGLVNIVLPVARPDAGEEGYQGAQAC